ncbi:hypothetical protein CIW54_26955 [Paraburkholderia sp. T12-10]|nr:hypothetical protein CIW54_26955 [Paraburkholderia sp. T12-10]
MLRATGFGGNVGAAHHRRAPGTPAVPRRATQVRRHAPHSIATAACPGLAAIRPKRRNRTPRLTKRPMRSALRAPMA